LSVTSTPSGDVVSGAGPSSTGSWNVTGLVPGHTYAFRITATNYDDYTTIPDYLAEPNRTYTQNVTLQPKPARATFAVSPGTAAGLNATVSANGSAMTGLGAPTGSGTWDVTGIPADGTNYTFTITSTAYKNMTFTFKPNPNEFKGFGTLTLVPKTPATVTVTIGGGARNATGATVVSDCGVTGVRGTGGGADTWTFTVPIGTAPCIFTYSGTGYVTTSTTPAYTAVEADTKNFPLTPAATPNPP
jgi:hypothetical protein